MISLNSFNVCSLIRATSNLPFRSVIINSAFEVHNTLGKGFLEQVNTVSLLYELKSRGLLAEKQKKIDVYYKGLVVGEYYADILVNDVIILEIKCVARIINPHIKQLRNYLHFCAYMRKNDQDRGSAAIRKQRQSLKLD